MNPNNQKPKLNPEYSVAYCDLRKFYRHLPQQTVSNIDLKLRELLLAIQTTVAQYDNREVQP